MSYAEPSVAIELTGRARRRRLMRKRFLRRPFAVIGLIVAIGFIVVRDLRAVDRAVRPAARPTSTRSSQHPSQRAPARHGRARPRRLLAPRLGVARLDRGRRVRDAARDGDRRPDRARRRLLPRLDRPGDRAAHRRPARVPVPDPRRRARGDPRPVASQRDDRARPRSGSGADSRLARRGARAVARRTTCAPRSRTARATRASSASTSSRTCLDDDRAGDRDDPGRDHRRGRAVVPRPRRPVAGDVVGRDALRREGLPRRRRRGSRSTPASRSSSARSRSTCSATACATSSIRARRGSA